MVPMARGADLDHITGEFALLRPLGERPEFLRRRDASTEGRKPRAEHIGDQNQIVVLTDRTAFARGLTHLTRRPHQLGVGVAHLVLGQSTLLELGDEVLSRESVIDLAASATGGTAEGS